jgi:hypothetical protein
MTSICFTTPHYLYLFYRDLKGFRAWSSSIESLYLQGHISLSGHFDLAKFALSYLFLPWGKIFDPVLDSPSFVPEGSLRGYSVAWKSAGTT